jgi:hypothetical protein
LLYDECAAESPGLLGTSGPSRTFPSRSLVRELPRPFAFEVSKIFPLEFETMVTLFHRYRQGDLIMIKQVIMPILVIEEPGMTRRDNRPYFQKNFTYDCLTTVKLVAKLPNTER